MKLIKSILIAILIFIVAYLFCAFYSTDFNIKNWHKAVRFVNVFFGAIGIYISCWYYNNEN